MSGLGASGLGKRGALAPADRDALAMIAAGQRDAHVDDQVEGMVAISSLIYKGLANDGDTKPTGLRRAAQAVRESRIAWESNEGLDDLRDAVWADPNGDAIGRAFLEMAAALHRDPRSPASLLIMDNAEYITDAALLQHSERSILPAHTAMEHAALVAQGQVSGDRRPPTAWPASLALDVLQAAARGGIFNVEDSPEGLYALSKEAGGGPGAAWGIYRAFGWKAFSKDMVLDVSNVNEQVAMEALVSISACASSLVDGPGPGPESADWAGASEVWRGACAGCFLGLMHPAPEVRKKAANVALSLRGDWEGARAQMFDANVIPDAIGFMH